MRRSSYEDGTGSRVRMEKKLHKVFDERCLFENGTASLFALRALRSREFRKLELHSPILRHPFLRLVIELG